MARRQAKDTGAKSFPTERRTVLKMAGVAVSAAAGPLVGSAAGATTPGYGAGAYGTAEYGQ